VSRAAFLSPQALKTLYPAAASSPTAKSLSSSLLPSAVAVLLGRIEPALKQDIDAFVRAAHGATAAVKIMFCPKSGRMIARLCLEIKNLI
jgi:hypothetical protein